MKTKKLMATPCHIYNNVSLISTKDIPLTNKSTQNSSSTPAEISRYVSYGFTAPGGKTLLVKNFSFISNFKISAAPCNALQQSFSNFLCTISSTDSISFGLNYLFPLTQSSIMILLTHQLRKCNGGKVSM